MVTLGERRRLALKLLEQCTEGVLVLDGDGSVRYVNTALYRLLGYDDDAPLLEPPLVRPVSQGLLHWP